ncbi:MAG: SDR family oxidoreductase [Acidocella sp.]|nr:SDR family oxidoreductase [Acidocella sp.]
MAEFTGRTALITGASSGIGADIARELAKRGANVVLVARRTERLETLATELAQTGVTASAVPFDLSDPTARIALAAAHPQVDILINNAGLGVFGMFADAAWDDLNNMLNVNMIALTHLTHLFAKPMADRGYGRVMMVASTAAFQPVPLYAAYAATKAYVLSLSEALNVEFKARDVRFTALCPGTTASEFFDVAHHKKSYMVEKSMMTSAAVAKIGVDAMAHNKTSVVAGLANALMAFSTRLSPRSMNAELAYKIMKP